MIYDISKFRTIVKNNILDIPNNSIITLIGTNGVGKSNFIDAIRHFNLSLENSKVRTTAKYDGDQIADEEIILISKLTNKELDSLFDKMKLIKINLDKTKEYFKYFAKSGANTYKYLFVKKDRTLTDLNILQNNIISKYKDIIPKKYLIEKDGYNLINWDEASKMYEWSNLQNKQTVYKVVETLKLTEEIFMTKPNLLFIENGTKDNDIVFKNNLEELKTESNKNIKKLLSFLHPDGVEIGTQILNLSTDEKDHTEKVENLKEKFKEKSNEKIKKLFNNFDIYAYPEVEFDGLFLKIKAKSKLTYKFNDTLHTKNNSSGYRSFLWFMLTLEIAKNYSKESSVNSIVLADEMDKNLHPVLQMQLVKYLIEDTKNWNNISILWTTHSPFLIPPNSENKMVKSYIIDRDFNGESYLIEYNNISSNNVLSAYTLFANQKIHSSVFLSTIPDKNVVFIDNSSSDDLELVKNKLKELNFKLEVIELSKLKEDGINYDMVVKSLKIIDDKKDLYEIIKFTVIVSLKITIYFQISSSNKNRIEKVSRELYFAYEKRQYFESKNTIEFFKNFGRYIIEVISIMNAYKIKKCWCKNCKKEINIEEDLLKFIEKKHFDEIFPWGAYYMFFLWTKF